MGPKDEKHNDLGRRRSSLRIRARREGVSGHVVAAIGEFVGTFLFLYFSYLGNVMAATHAEPTPAGVNGPKMTSQTSLVIAVAYGFALLVNVWAFYRISGGLFNPALPWLRVAFLFPAQILGSMCAGGLVACMIPGGISNANTVLGADVSIAQGVFLEMFFTAQLVFVVLMLAMEKSKDTFLAPVGIGLTLFVVMVGGTPYTGASLNPARSLGCAVPSSFPGYHWIYWVGPALGAALAAGFYRFIKYANYEEANPGQDSAGPSEENLP